MLILRKSDYRETSLIIAGITPEYGRLDLVVKGEKSLGKKKFPVIDLYRTVEVEYSKGSGTLHNFHNADILASIGEELAKIPDNFLLASELAELILKTAHYELPCPETYTAALTIYDMLAAIISDDPHAAAKRSRCAAMLKLVILSENGLLPENLDPDPDVNVEKHDVLDHILASAQGLDDPPPNTGRFWVQMDKWADVIIKRSELHS